MLRRKMTDFLKGLDIRVEELPKECRDINEIIRNTSSPEEMEEHLENMIYYLIIMAVITQSQ